MIPAGKKTETALPQCEPPKRAIESLPVKVTVTKEGRVVVEPASLTLKVAARQEAEWKSPDGTLEIRFSPKQTPFSGPGFRSPQGAASRSGIPDRKKIRKNPYRYIVIVTTKDDIFISQNQEIIVA
jgi:hypothetical protein